MCLSNSVVMSRSLQVLILPLSSFLAQQTELLHHATTVAVISICDRTIYPAQLDRTAFIRAEFEKAGHLFLQQIFDDVDNVTTTQRQYGPTHAHLLELVEFADQIKQTTSIVKLVVHCRAGVSRSTAAAFIVLRELGYDRDAAMKLIRETSAFAEPHAWLLKEYEQYRAMSDCEVKT